MFVNSFLFLNFIHITSYINVIAIASANLCELLKPLQNAERLDL